jgi:hypothetical protein
VLFLHLYYSRGGMSLDSSVSPILATNFLKHNDPSLCCTYICNRGGLSLDSTTGIQQYTMPFCKKKRVKGHI